MIPFDQMPTSIQAIFRSVKRECTCKVRLVKGEERYYVTHRGETTRFVWQNGGWFPDKTYGVRT